MYILGIMAFGKNPGACLLKDGRLVSFCQEERLNRLKGSHGLFPSKTVQWILNFNNISLSDIHKIAFPWDCKKYPTQMFRHVTKMRISIGSNPYETLPSSVKEKGNFWSAMDYLSEWTERRVSEQIRDNLRDIGCSGKIPPIEFIEHHTAHAYQAFFHSPFEQSNILVIDGSGEEKCTQGYVYKDGRLKNIFSYDIPNSLGWFYAAITAYLGFIPYRDEGKVMGLAALGEVNKDNNPWLERLQKVIKITFDGYELDPYLVKFGGHELHQRFTDSLFKFITGYDQGMVPISYGETITKDNKKIPKYLLTKYIDIAWAAQELMEQAVVNLSNRLYKASGIRNICIAGGVGMNCKMNGVIVNNTEMNNIFVHPASSDDGSCIGAAMVVAQSCGDNIKHPLRHVQYGPSFTDSQIEKVLKECKLNYKGYDDVAAETAKMVFDKKIVGWFQGGCEFGARALGGRSILANPVELAIKDKVNNEVKFRESWRPFCPSLLDEEKDKYLINSKDARFMIVACKTTDYLLVNAPATVHVDNTVRPQTVQGEIPELSLYYDYIKKLGNLSGHGVTLNTSFNVRGEPIVCTPYDAVRCFYASGLDALTIGSFILIK